MSYLVSIDRKKRVKIREILGKIDENRKRQIETLNEGLINPLRKQRELIRNFLRNQEHLEQVIKHNEAVNKLIVGLLRV